MNLPTKLQGPLDTFLSERDSKLRLVGTDGYVLSYSEIFVQFPDLFCKMEFACRSRL